MTRFCGRSILLTPSKCFRHFPRNSSNGFWPVTLSTETPGSETHRRTDGEPPDRSESQQRHKLNRSCKVQLRKQRCWCEQNHKGTKNVALPRSPCRTELRFGTAVSDTHSWLYRSCCQTKPWRLMGNVAVCAGAFPFLVKRQKCYEHRNWRTRGASAHNTHHRLSRLLTGRNRTTAALQGHDDDSL